MACLEDVSDNMYKTIEKMIVSTFDCDKVGKGRDAKRLDHTGIVINDIQRVFNKSLFRSYCDFRDNLHDKTADGDSVDIGDFPVKLWQFKRNRRHVEVNEIYLFHGTSEDAADSIIDDGFDLDNFDPNALYGQGIYFSEEVTKADQYTDDKRYRDPNGTELTLLLCRVLLGNAYTCPKHHAEKFTRPPCMVCDKKRCRHGWKKRYDSVLGSGPNMLFREFVVYDERQCFPEFLVKYERVGGWEPLYDSD